MANFALAWSLAERGAEVHLVTHQADEQLLSHRNMIAHLVPKPLGSYLLGRPLLDACGRRWARAVAARAGRVVVNGGNCRWGDVNWVHYVHAAHERRATAGGLHGLRLRCAHRMSLQQERVALQQARLIIANSQRTKRDLVEQLGLRPERIRTIYLGVDGERFRPFSSGERARARSALGWSGQRPVVAFVGALGDWRKGFDRLFAAWRLLCSDSRWDADLAVAGAGAELPAWQRSAQEAGLSGRILYLGFRKDVDTVLAAADALVSPTRYDSYGLNVQEALCAGLPALVSANAGVAERYPAELQDLLLPDSDQPDELAEALWRWRRQMTGFREAATRLSATLRRHTWERMADEMIGAMEAAA